MTGPSLTANPVRVFRKQAGTDREGQPLRDFVQVDAFRGGFGAVSTEYADVVGSAGQRIDAAVSTLATPDVMVGDKVIVKAQNWVVVGVTRNNLTTRILLAKWGNR